MFLAVSITSKPSLPILSPSLLVERQAGFSPRYNLSPSTSCMWNEIGKRQRRVTHASPEHLCLHPWPKGHPRQHTPQNFPQWPLPKLRLIAWKPKYSALVGQSLPLLQQHWLPRSSQTDKTKGRAEYATWPALVGLDLLFNELPVRPLGCLLCHSYQLDQLRSGRTENLRKHLSQLLSGLLAEQQHFKPLSASSFLPFTIKETLKCTNCETEATPSYFLKPCPQSSHDQRILYNLRHLWCFYLPLSCNAICL